MSAVRSSARLIAVAVAMAMLSPAILLNPAALAAPAFDRPSPAAPASGEPASDLFADWDLDRDRNGLDDRLDGDLAAGLTGFVLLHVHYGRRPTADDGQLLRTEFGANRTYVFRNFDIVKAEIDYSGVARLLDAPGVVAVEKFIPPVLQMDVSKKAVRANAASGVPVSGGIDHALAVHETLGYRGEGMVIAILDTGVDDTHESLDDLDDDPDTNDPKQLQKTDPTTGLPVYAAADASDGFVIRECVNVLDDMFHGTHVAGTALGTGGPSGLYSGVAPKAHVVDVDINTPFASPFGFGLGLGEDLGMDWIISFNKGETCYGDPGEDRIDVASMSFGAGGSSSTTSQSLSITAVARAGITMTVSAGNSGDAANTLTVGADGGIIVANQNDRNTIIRTDDTLASTSSRGPRPSDGDTDTLDELRPDIAAPGTNIMAPLFHSVDQYWSLSGTSMAAPHVAGVAALMLQANPDLRPVATGTAAERRMGEVGAVPVRDVIQQTAQYKTASDGAAMQQTATGKFGLPWNNGWGYGAIDAYAAVLKAIELRAGSLSVDAGGPYFGLPGAPVVLTAVATGGTGPYTYSWTFGDGGTGSGAVASHTYAAEGTYTATVQVTDSSVPPRVKFDSATVAIGTSLPFAITFPTDGASLTGGTVTIEGLHTLGQGGGGGGVEFDDASGDQTLGFVVETPVPVPIPYADIVRGAIAESGDNFVMTIEVAELADPLESNAHATYYFNFGGHPTSCTSAAGSGTGSDYFVTTAIRSSVSDPASFTARGSAGVACIVGNVGTRVGLPGTVDVAVDLDENTITFTAAKSIFAAGSPFTAGESVSDINILAQGCLCLPSGSGAPVSGLTPTYDTAVSGEPLVIGSGGGGGLGTVEVAIDDALFSASAKLAVTTDVSGGTWEADWDITGLTATHRIYARQLDGQGGVVASHNVGVILNGGGSLPFVTITSPLDGAQVAGTISVTGTSGHGDPPDPDNVLPTATLTPDVSTGTAPLLVKFTVDGADADGTIASWDLDFGDGSPHTGANGDPDGTEIPHTYTTAGRFTARLCVLDNDAAGACVERILDVILQPPPTDLLRLYLHGDTVVGQADRVSDTLDLGVGSLTMTTLEPGAAMVPDVWVSSQQLGNNARTSPYDSFWVYTNPVEHENVLVDVNFWAGAIGAPLAGNFKVALYADEAAIPFAIGLASRDGGDLPLDPVEYKVTLGAWTSGTAPTNADFDAIAPGVVDISASATLTLNIDGRWTDEEGVFGIFYDAPPYPSGLRVSSGGSGPAIAIDFDPRPYNSVPGVGGLDTGVFVAGNTLNPVARSIQLSSATGYVANFVVKDPAGVVKYSFTGSPLAPETDNVGSPIPGMWRADGGNYAIPSGTPNGDWTVSFTITNNAGISTTKVRTVIVRGSPTSPSATGEVGDEDTAVPPPQADIVGVDFSHTSTHLVATMELADLVLPKSQLGESPDANAIWWDVSFTTNTDYILEFTAVTGEADCAVWTWDPNGGTTGDGAWTPARPEGLTCDYNDVTDTITMSVPLGYVSLLDGSGSPAGYVTKTWAATWPNAFVAYTVPFDAAPTDASRLDTGPYGEDYVLGGGIGDTIPPTFAGLASAIAGDRTVSLSWAPGSDDQPGAVTYDVYMATAAAGVFGNKIGETTSVEFTVQDLTNGQQYFFGVRARDVAGNAEANVVVLSATPTSGSGGGARVEVGVNGVFQNANGINPWSFPFDTTTLANGPATLSARYFDGVTTSPTVSIGVTIANGQVQVPVIDILSPAEGARISGTFGASGSTGLGDGGGGGGTNHAPTATLSADVTSGVVPLPVTFTVGGTDEDGDPLTYALVFGDGSSTTLTAPGTATHTYTMVGAWIATLTVSDGRGGITTATRTILASNPGDILTLVSGGPYFARADLGVTLLASATGGSAPYTFEWDLDDDGVFETPQGSGVLFNRPASADGYPLSVRVRDGALNEETASTRAWFWAREILPVTGSDVAGAPAGCASDAFVCFTGGSAFGYLDMKDPLEGPGENAHGFPVVVTSQTTRVDAVITWTVHETTTINVPGLGPISVALNDYDLLWESPSGEFRRGDAGTGGYSYYGASGGRPEQSVLLDPAPGTWTLWVQPFAMKAADTFTGTITVDHARDPRPSADVGHGFLAQNGVSNTLTIEPTGAFPPFAVEWVLPDGARVSGASASFTPQVTSGNGPGQLGPRKHDFVTLEATATVTDARGDSSTETVPIHVRNVPRDAEVVIAVIDTGIIPYHDDFEEEGLNLHPSTYIPDYPRSAPALNFCVDESLAACSTVQKARQTDAALVSSIVPAQLYWIPGTKYVGAIHFGSDNGPNKILDDQGHGSGTTSAAGGNIWGSCPGCKLVGVEVALDGSINQAILWASTQPWIDVISISIGSLANAGAPMAFNEDQLSRIAARNGKVIAIAAGNGASNFVDIPDPTFTTTSNYVGPSWVLVVGAISPINGQDYYYHDHPADVSSYGLHWRTSFTGDAAGQPSNPGPNMQYSNEFGGTSCATPVTAGAVGAVLLEARRAVKDHGTGARTNSDGETGLALAGPGATLPSTGPLANGVLTRMELEDAVMKTAIPGDTPSSLGNSLLLFSDFTWPNHPAYFVREGFGLVNQMTAVGVSTRPSGFPAGPPTNAPGHGGTTAKDVVLGLKPFPNRFVVEGWMTAVDAYRDAYWHPNPLAPEFADTDDDAYPQSSPPVATGGPDTSVTVPDLVKRQATTGSEPSTSGAVLYLHNTAADGFFLNTLATVDNERSGQGSTGAGTTTFTFPVKNPALSNAMTFDTSKKTNVVLSISTFLVAPVYPDFPITVTLEGSGGKTIATGTVTRTLGGTIGGARYVYELDTLASSFVPATDGTLQLRVSGPFPGVNSWHFTTNGASYVALPIAGSPSLVFPTTESTTLYLHKARGPANSCTTGAIRWASTTASEDTGTNCGYNPAGAAFAVFDAATGAVLGEPSPAVVDAFEAQAGHVNYPLKIRTGTATARIYVSSQTGTALTLTAAVYAGSQLVGSGTGSSTILPLAGFQEMAFPVVVNQEALLTAADRHLVVYLYPESGTGDWFYSHSGAAKSRIDGLLLSPGVAGNAPPVVTVTANPSSGVAPLSSQVRVQVTDPDSATLSTLNLVFGDGASISTLTNVALPFDQTFPHDYTLPGAYVAIATAVDPTGLPGSSSASVTATLPVTVEQQTFYLHRTADVGPTGPNCATGTRYVDREDTADAGHGCGYNPLGAAFAMGEAVTGSPVLGLTIVDDFPFAEVDPITLAAGPVTARMYVTSDSGNSLRLRLTMLKGSTVLGQSEASALLAPAAPYTPFDFSFSLPSAIEIDPSDPSTNLVFRIKAVQSTGDWFYGYDSPGVSSASLPVLTSDDPVDLPPIPDLRVDRSILEQGESVLFTVSATDDVGVTFWELTFGDGSSIDSGAGPIVFPQMIGHQYNVVGSADATLLVRDTAGQERTDTVSLTITAIPNLAPVASISGPDTAQVGSEVTFDLDATDDTGIASWSVAWGDGTSDEGLGQPPATLGHTYTSVGPRTAFFLVTDDDGESDSATADLGVVGVEVRLGGSAYAVATPAAPGDWATWSIDLDSLAVPSGPQTLSARWYDGDAFASDSIDVNVENVARKAIAQFTSPAANSKVGGVVQLSGSATVEETDLGGAGGMGATLAGFTGTSNLGGTDRTDAALTESGQLWAPINGLPAQVPAAARNAITNQARNALASWHSTSVTGNSAGANHWYVGNDNRLEYDPLQNSLMQFPSSGTISVPTTVNVPGEGDRPVNGVFVAFDIKGTGEEFEGDIFDCLDVRYRQGSTGAFLSALDSNANACTPNKIWQEFGGYTPMTVALPSSLIGRTMQVQFRFISDNTVQLEGYHLDGIRFFVSYPDAAPELSGPAVTPSIGNTDTVARAEVDYCHTTGVAPGRIQAILNPGASETRLNLASMGAGSMVCPAKVRYGADLPLLPVGVHSILFEAETVGKVAQAGPLPLDIANRLPTLTDPSVDPIGTITTDTDVTFRVTYTDLDGHAPTAIHLLLDGEPRAMTLESGSPAIGAVYAYGTKLALGRHVHSFDANDGFGGVAIGPFDGPTVFAGQSQPPILSQGGVSPETGIDGTSFAWSVKYADPNGDPPANVEVVVDGVPQAMTCPVGDYLTGVVCSYSSDTLAIGTHTFYFRGEQQSRHPSSGVRTGPTVFDHVSRVEVCRIGGTCADATGSGGSLASWTSPLDTRSLAHGRVDLTAQGFLASTGAAGPTGGLIIFVNNPPVAGLSATPASALTFDSITLDASASTDDDLANAMYRFDFGDGSPTLTQSGPIVPHSYLDGTNAGRLYTASVVVIDSDGVESAPATAVVTILNRAPTASISGPTSTPTNSVVTFDGSGSSDLDGSIASYLWTIDGQSFSGASVQHSFTTKGSRTVTLKVVDDDGAESTVAEHTITVVNTAPVLGAIGDRSVVKGHEVTIDLSGQDPDGEDTLTFTASGVPATITATSPRTGTFRWATTLSDVGPHPVRVTVSDGSTTDFEDFTIQVLDEVSAATNTRTGAAYDLIQRAIDEAAAGDTIVLAQGTYDEALSIAKPLTLCQANPAFTGCGSDPADVVVRSTSGVGIRVLADGVTLEGFTLLVSGDSGDGRAYGVDVPSPSLARDLTVENMILRPDTDAGQATGENAVRGRLANAVVGDVEMSGWATAVFFRPYGEANTVSDSRIHDVGTGVSTHSPRTSVLGNTFSNVLLQAVDIAEVSDVTTSAAGNVLRDNDFSLVATALRLRGPNDSSNPTSDIVVDARMNEWGTDALPVVRAKVRDNGAGNTVLLVPVRVGGSPEPGFPSASPGHHTPATSAACSYDADFDGFSDLYWDGAACRFLTVQAAVAFAHAGSVVAVPMSANLVDPTPRFEAVTIGTNSMGEALDGLTLCSAPPRSARCMGEARGAAWTIFGAAFAPAPAGGSGEALRAESAADSGFATVGMALPAGTRIQDLYNLELDAYYEQGSCGGGSPRFVFSIDRNGDGASDANLNLYAGPFPAYSGCAAGRWLRHDLQDGNARWDAQGLGGPFYTTQANAAALAGPNHRVLRVTLIWDSAWATPGPVEVAWFDNVRVNDVVLMEPAHLGCTGAANTGPACPQGMATAGTILDGAGAATVVHIAASGVSIEGLTIRNPTRVGGGQAIRVASDGVSIERNVITGGGLADGMVDTEFGVVLAGAGMTPSRVANNEISRWENSGVYVGGSHVGPVVVEDNRLVENGVGLRLEGTRPGSPVTVAGNAIERNPDRGIAMDTDRPVTMRENSIAANGKSVHFSDRFPGYTLDARGNHWGVVGREVIPTTFDDPTRTHVVRYMPYLDASGGYHPPRPHLLCRTGSGSTDEGYPMDLQDALDQTCPAGVGRIVGLFLDAEAYEPSVVADSAQIAPENPANNGARILSIGGRPALRLLAGSSPVPPSGIPATSVRDLEIAIVGGTGILAEGLPANYAVVSISRVNFVGLGSGVVARNGGGVLVQDNTFDGVLEAVRFENAGPSVVRRNVIQAGSAAASTFLVYIRGDDSAWSMGHRVDYNTILTAPSATSTQSPIVVWSAIAPVVEANTIVGSMVPGSIGIALRSTTSGMVVDNRIDGANLGVYVRDSTGARVERNTITAPAANEFASFSVGMSLFLGSGHRLADNVVTGPAVGLLNTGSAGARSDRDSFETASASIQLNRDFTGAQPSGFVVRDGRLLGGTSGLALGSTTHDLAVDAECNFWGEEHADAIRATRISMGGTRNTVDFEPFYGTTGSGLSCLRAPTAAFTASTTVARRGDVISFADASTAGDRSITDWAWTFGDGATSTARNPTHAYTGTGTFDVTLTVKDAAGLTGTTAIAIRIVNLAPVANFALSPSSGITAATTVTATDASTDDGNAIVSRSWSVRLVRDTTPDGIADTPGVVLTGSGSPFSFRLPDDGEYEISLTVTDSEGLSGTATRAIYASNLAPSVGGNAPPYARPGVATTLWDTSGDADGSIVEARWDLDGDGTYETVNPGSYFGHTFSAGSQVVRHRVVDDDGAVSTRSWSLVVDGIAPVTTASAPSAGPGGAYSSSSVDVTFSRSDSGGSGVDATTVNLDGEIIRRTGTGSFTVTVVGEGLHTLEYQTVDRAGNVESLRTLTIRIDTSPPSATMTRPSTASAGPARIGGVFLAGDPIVLAASASDAGSGVVAVEFRVDGAVVGVDTDGSNGWSVVWDSHHAEFGPHGIVAVALNGAGLAGSSPEATVLVVGAKVGAPKASSSDAAVPELSETVAAATRQTGFDVTARLEE